MFSTLYLRLREAVVSHQEGQGVVEYAFILVLIALVVIVALSVLGKSVKNDFSNISNGLTK